MDTRKPLPWAEYFQTPEYLEYTRKFLIPTSLRPVLLAQMGVFEGTKVLDVGCGTGYFSRFIAEGAQGAEITGLDREEIFIRSAGEYAEREGKKIRFVKGDGTDLPFEDNSFDVVTSHTFLTSVPAYEKAMAEMVRVCRHGGIVSSVTAMSFLPALKDPGCYPDECDWVAPLERMLQKVWTMYEAINPTMAYAGGIATAKIPRLFSGAGLKEIGAYPVGKVFSLSNAMIPAEEKADYLRLMLKAEGKKIGKFMELEKARKYLSPAEAEEYLNLLRRKADFYISHPGENEVWEWDGGVNVLITGVKP